METIKQILLRRDDMTSDEADDLINDARKALDYALANGHMQDAEEICADYFGLEPDYLTELIQGE